MRCWMRLPGRDRRFRDLSTLRDVNITEYCISSWAGGDPRQHDKVVIWWGFLARREARGYSSAGP